MSRLSIKFLLPNALAGSLIGTGGSAIKELMEVSEARVTVSGVSDVYPGTSDRVVLISGPHESVDVAQGLVWEMIASNIAANGDRSVVWSPRAAHEADGLNSEVEVTGKISVPASAGGLLLGKGGAVLRAMAEESDVNVQMTSRDDAMFTQERILTVSGMAGHCDKFVSLVLSKLAEDPDSAQYVNKGLSYSFHHFLPAPRGGRRVRDENVGGGLDEVGSTEISFTVPDVLVGNILGKQGSTMREIMSLSGAKVSVSKRDGNTNRTVTITGTPANAQTAHMLITRKLQHPTSAPRTRRSKLDA